MTTDSTALQFAPGAGGLPTAIMTAPDGARVTVYLQGGHIASWVPAGGEEQLFLSATSGFQPGVAIRGGVPICFPQFSGYGPLPKHGFARTLPWTVGESQSNATGANANGTVQATFLLRDDEATRALWPHAFTAELSVAVGGKTLEIGLKVTNTASTNSPALAFTGALHTYLRVADVHKTTVTRLQGTRYRDQVLGNQETVQSEPMLNFMGEVDRIYLGAPRSVIVREPERQREVRATGFPDVVVWNPGAGKGATLADLEPDGYRHYVCVEAAVVGTPIQLAPGASWQGKQVIVA